VFRTGLLGILVGAALSGCAGEPGTVETRVRLDPAAPDFGTVEVWGLPPALRKALARIPAQDPGWSAALTVRAVAGREAVPPLVGQYGIAAKGCLRFAPRFPPEGPLSYHIRLDPTALARLAGRRPESDTVREWRFQLPGLAVPAPSTVVSAVHPSAGIVPANQLRWYVEFSAPMREGEAAERVHLLDARGQEIRGAFLSVQQELWDPERRRITLLFDMGRVKRGIRTRIEAGPVLRPGKRYALRIDADWRDARGAPLVRGVVHRLRAGPEDHAPVNPGRWSLRAPAIGSRAPLELDFGEPLDHALAQRLIAVQGPDGPVAGEVALSADDRRWRFSPHAPWLAGRYRLRVHPALEDLAGNRLGHAFDADLGRGQRAGVDSLGVTLEFSPQIAPITEISNIGPVDLQILAF
jgi:hypothetical protein